MIRIKPVLLLIFLNFIVVLLNANPFFNTKADTIINTFNKDFIYNIKKSQSEIIIDGVIEERGWLEAQKADNFRLVLPIDTGFAAQPSEIMMTYDEKALYIAQIFYDTIPGKRIMESFRRDFNFGSNDNLLVFFRHFSRPNQWFFFRGFGIGGKMGRFNVEWISY